jgi:TrmH family RNA methyltransferase
MISKNQVKYLQSLRLSKFREQCGEFIVEGVKMAEELLRSEFTTRQVFATPGWISRNGDLEAKVASGFQEVTEDELKRISGLVSPNEVLAVAAIPGPGGMQQPETGPMVLVLDRIQDPGNLGTIIRTADWFGIRQIICAEGTADVYNPKVVQATMGSLFRISLRYEEPGKALTELAAKGMIIYGAMAGGENLYDLEIRFPAALVIGNESQGISEALYPLLHNRVAIPGLSSGAESLNAAVATGILCAEFARRPAM